VTVFSGISKFLLAVNSNHAANGSGFDNIYNAR